MVLKYVWCRRCGPIYLFKYKDSWLTPVSMVMKRVELELLRAIGFLWKTLMYGFPVEMPE